MIKTFDINERVAQAMENFGAGYNCSQSVFLAYADVFDLDLEMAKKMSLSFGGGMGRMREVCGTISALSMLAGFRYPVTDPSDQQARTLNYAVVQRMAERFKEKHNTIICRELLANAATAAKTDPAPELRTVEYYSSRPCSKYVADAAYIAGQMLNGELE